MLFRSYEYTDTFGGESNYSWVRRGELDVPEKTSDLAVVRRVKKELGLTGSRFARLEKYNGDTIALWHPDHACTVLFISFVGM